MRVLITGGYGFIGSHVADRFYKEGYEVFIIDNLSTGKKENITFKHKGYVLSVEDVKCEELFNSFQFDVVVHLAAQVSVANSIVNPREDTASNTVGLVNILALSEKYKVKKFIFSSSAAVYGLNEQLPLTEKEPCSPISPYGISKWVGEIYCEKWKEVNGFDNVCFRFSNVYGPRQNNDGEGGVICKFVNNIIQGKPLHILGDGGQTRDFIYVADVVDAIFKASNSPVTGIYNLSTNTETSVNNLVSILTTMHGKAEAHYLAARDGDIYKSVLSNTKVKDALDWSPLYSMEEGLRQTYRWAVTHQAAMEIAVTTDEDEKKAP